MSGRRRGRSGTRLRQDCAPDLAAERDRARKALAAVQAAQDKAEAALQRARAAYERAVKANARAAKSRAAEGKFRAAATRAETRLSRARAETGRKEDTLRAALEKGVPVTAPSAGTVGASRLVAGGKAEAGDMLFEITPPQ